MAVQKERILIVENDPFSSDILARQVLEPQGYQVRVVSDATSALKEVVSFRPDLILANLELAALSGKDLMVMLNARNYSSPVIMIAPMGKEQDVIQSFRVGATDYLRSPIRETEVLSAVERALCLVRDQKEKKELSEKLKQSNALLQKRLAEMTTLFNIGKAVVSINDHNILFNAILEGGVNITEADLGWLLVRDDQTGKMNLSFQIHLPKSLEKNVGKPWEDGVSSLVELSGETFRVEGEPLQQFVAGRLGKAAMVAPVRVRDQIIALMGVMRKDLKPFSETDESMLEAVCDYATVALANAKLFKVLDEQVETIQRTEKRIQRSDVFKTEVLKGLTVEIAQSLNEGKHLINKIMDGKLDPVTAAQKEGLEILSRWLEHMQKAVDAITVLQEISSPGKPNSLVLQDLANQAIGRFQKQAKENGNRLDCEFPTDPISVLGDRHQINMVFDALLENALKYNKPDTAVTIKLSVENNYPTVSIIDQGIGVSSQNIDRIFTPFYRVENGINEKIDGLGLGLSIAKEIIEAHKGKVWADSKLETGMSIHFSLPSGQK